MRSLSDTVERLKRYSLRPDSIYDESRLCELEDFGKNPGELTGWHHVPHGLVLPALVVVLHECTQTAASYDEGSGWSKLADDFGFAVLFPEQARQNNRNLCFNWFYGSDVDREHGEVKSIREIIATMIADQGIDPRRVFITGLSAGGAMANAMLAVYPEVFAGGAIIAALPYGAAVTIPQAFDRMRGYGLSSPESSQKRLRAASSHAGPWPSISVWQGTADTTVDQVNAEAIVEQWSAVHDVRSPPAKHTNVEGHDHFVWSDVCGHEMIELHRIKDMGHGTPLDTAGGYGRAGPFLLDIGISSTKHIARGWGLIPSFAAV